MRLSAVVDEDEIRGRTRVWIERVVVGLDLCPFAAEPFRAGRVRLVVCEADGPERLARALADELTHLDRVAPDEVETTLLVHPLALLDFDAYNDFLDVGDLLLEKLGLVGSLQIASFHPDYRFAGVSPEDVANATNQSPYPMLHLLRESSVARAVAAHPDPGSIPKRNTERLRALGWDEVVRLRGRPRA